MNKINNNNARNAVLLFTAEKLFSCRKIIFFAIPALFYISGCSHPVILKPEDVKVKREAPDKTCQSLGLVQGSVIHASGTTEQALEDMKKDAARKGANYVFIQTTSALGSSVRGEAYFCP